MIASRTWIHTFVMTTFCCDLQNRTNLSHRYKNMGPTTHFHVCKQNKMRSQMMKMATYIKWSPGNAMSRREIQVMQVFYQPEYGTLRRYTTFQITSDQRGNFFLC